MVRTNKELIPSKGAPEWPKDVYLTRPATLDGRGGDVKVIPVPVRAFLEVKPTDMPENQLADHMYMMRMNHPERDNTRRRRLVQRVWAEACKAGSFTRSYYEYNVRASS